MMKLKHALPFFLLASAFWMSWKAASLPNNSVTTCEIAIDDDLSMELGQSTTLEIFTSCPTDEIVDVTWSPMDYLTCQNPNCLEVSVTPLASICYDVTINWLDGCVSTEDICITLKECPETFDDSHILGITPNPIDDLAIIEMQVSRFQYIHYDIIDDGEVSYPIKEGWTGSGVRDVELDFSNIPPGNYELRATTYPEFRYIDITIN